MRDYLNSKISEYSILLDWIENEISKLQGKGKNHSYMIDCIENNIVELRKLYNRLQIIACIENHHIYRRAFPIIHDIEYQLRVVTYYYLPALYRENTNDLFLRWILLSTVKRCGLSWIKDIVVPLDRPHSILPVFTEIPIIYAPPQHCVSLSDMAGFYHEFGHCVFQHFNKIADNLVSTVFQYYSGLKESVGPITPEKRAERDRVIDQAIDYWNVERLNEIFSDIYATYVCGPAYYFSCVDVSIGIGSNIFRINTTDVHPPWATRVYACYKMLSPIYYDNKVITLINEFWGTFTELQQKYPDFEIVCANALIEQIVDEAKQNIKRFLPNAQAYSEKIPDSSKIKEISQHKTLESTLNNRLKILLTEPEYYPTWEENIFKILRSQSC